MTENFCNSRKVAAQAGRQYFTRTLGAPVVRQVTWKLKLGRIICQPFSLNALVRLLSDNHYEVDSGYRERLINLVLLSLWHSIFTTAERLMFSRKLETVRINSPPVFVLGHWRSGTTFLHNVLCQNPAFTYPKVYHALFAGCFLLPGIRQLAQILDRRTPVETRPMDAIRLGMHEPFEDEFILTALTGISPYTRIWFPRAQGPGRAYQYPDPSVEEQQRWRSEFLGLMKRLTLLEDKTIVLKSPPHMARIPLLLEMFPDARFIHIVRHPYKVFVSNLKLWQVAFSLGALQHISEAEIVEVIFNTYRHLFRKYENDKKLIPKGQLVEITYEDFVRAPYESVESIYARLNLGGISSFAGKLKNYLNGLKQYKSNKYTLPEDIKREVRRRWSCTFDNYGYRD